MGYTLPECAFSSLLIYGFSVSLNSQLRPGFGSLFTVTSIAFTVACNAFNSDFGKYRICSILRFSNKAELRGDCALMKFFKFIIRAKFYEDQLFFDGLNILRDLFLYSTFYAVINIFPSSMFTYIPLVLSSSQPPCSLFIATIQSSSQAHIHSFYYYFKCLFLFETEFLT